MKPHSTFLFPSVTLGLTAILMLAGCGKTEDSPAPTEAPSATPPAAVAPAQPQAVPQTVQAAPEQWTREVQTYQQTGDYDKAAQYLLSIQQQQLRQLNEQQTAAYWNQMRSFQSDLATRVAAGDPKAIAAAEKLRASAGR